MICAAGAVYISKVVHSSYRSYIDVGRGRTALNTFIVVLRQCSVEDDDLPGRSSRMVVQFWNKHQAEIEACQKPPTLKVASRMLFSIIHDATWLWREKYGAVASNGAPSLPPPFIPTSSSAPLSVSSTVPLQSPSMSTLLSYSSTGKDANASPLNGSQVVNPIQVMDDNNDELLISPPDESTIDRDFESARDIGFFNSHTSNFNLPMSDFSMAHVESSWI